MGRKVNVLGVGMVKFQKPGASDGYEVMAGGAIKDALKDAGVDFKELEQAYAGYVFGDSTCGQRAVYSVGITGIPVINVNNNCSTGSTALYLARQAIEGGLAECVLAVGFEQMEKGALASRWNDRTNPLDKHVDVMNAQQGVNQAPFAAADVRRRRPRVPLEVRHQARDLREDLREGAQARREEPLRALQRGALGGGDPRQRRGVRPAHALPVLPADLRRGRGDSLLRRVRQDAQGLEARGQHRRPGDDHRLRLQLRGRRR